MMRFSRVSVQHTPSTSDGLPVNVARTDHGRLGCSTVQASTQDWQLALGAGAQQEPGPKALDNMHLQRMC
jgi:hypothetical protein